MKIVKALKQYYMFHFQRIGSKKRHRSLATTLYFQVHYFIDGQGTLAWLVKVTKCSMRQVFCVGIWERS